MMMEVDGGQRPSARTDSYHLAVTAADAACTISTPPQPSPTTAVHTEAHTCRPPWYVAQLAEIQDGKYLHAAANARGGAEEGDRKKTAPPALKAFYDDQRWIVGKVHICNM